MSEGFVSNIPPPAREAEPKYADTLLELVKRAKGKKKDTAYHAEFDTHGKANARRRALLRSAEWLAADENHPEIDRDSFSIVTRYNTRTKPANYSVYAEYHPPKKGRNA